MRKTSFTIIELLIVVAVLVILISLLQPSLKTAVDNANLIYCQNKMKAIMTGFSLFAEDHDGSLPGSVRDNTNEDLQKRSWIGTETGHRENEPSQKMRWTRDEGTVWPYLGEGLAGDFYRCPSIETGVWSSGVGSNGLFDYVALNAFSGAKISLLPNVAYFGNAPSEENYIPALDQMEKVSIPLIAEESDKFWLNRTHIEAGHGGRDRLANRHFGGSNVASIDGSVSWIEFVYRGPQAFEWRVQAPKGNFVGLGNGNWGAWNSR